MFKIILTKIKSILLKAKLLIIILFILFIFCFIAYLFQDDLIISFREAWINQIVKDLKEAPDNFKNNLLVGELYRDHSDDHAYKWYMSKGSPKGQYYGEKGHKSLRLSQQYLEKAVELKPNNCEALLALGITYRELYSYDLALEKFNKMKPLCPKNPQLYYEMANALNYKQTKQKIDLYQKAISLNPNYEEAYYKLGCVYFSINEKLALDNINKAISINPKNEEYVITLAHYYDQKDNNQKAKEYYQKVLKINYWNQSAQIALKRILRLEKRNKDSYSSF